MTSPENMNLLWASLIFEALQQLGLQHCVISPGSRSSPLALAAARHPQLELQIIGDERSAAFYALGWGRATGRAAVLICSSGTAVANYYPAVIEAAQDRVPLLIISADRPPELQHTGANQTIQQNQIFGHYPVLFRALPCPDPDFTPRALIQACTEAWEHSAKGPVHLNQPFREPLAPRPQPQPEHWQQALRKLQQGELNMPRSYRPQAALDRAGLERAQAQLSRAQRGLIILGRLPQSLHNANVEATLSAFNWPIMADVLSGFRFKAFAQHLNYHDLLLQIPEFKTRCRPDCILLVGDAPVSGPLLRWLKSLAESEDKPDCVQLLPHGGRADPHGLVDILLRGELRQGLESLQRFETPQSLWLENPAKQMTDFVQTRLAQSWQEPAVLNAALELLPQDWGLFLGNSLSIRQVNSFASHVPMRAVAANRGTSGIDGNLSTALGWGQGLQAPVLMICGDLTLLHDLNALKLLRDHPLPFVLLVLNNDGGGIFHFLPLAREVEQPESGDAAHFERCFGTPHGLQFKEIARGFGLNYAQPEHLQALKTALEISMLSGQTSLIEVRTQRAENQSWQAQLTQDLRAHLYS